MPNLHLAAILGSLILQGCAGSGALVGLGGVAPTPEATDADYRPESTVSLGTDWGPLTGFENRRLIAFDSAGMPVKGLIITPGIDEVRLKSWEFSEHMGYQIIEVLKRTAKGDFVGTRNIPTVGLLVNLDTEVAPDQITLKVGNYMGSNITVITKAADGLILNTSNSKGGAATLTYRETTESEFDALIQKQRADNRVTAEERARREAELRKYRQEAFAEGMRDFMRAAQTVSETSTERSSSYEPSSPVSPSSGSRRAEQRSESTGGGAARATVSEPRPNYDGPVRIRSKNDGAKEPRTAQVPSNTVRTSKGSLGSWESAEYNSPQTPPPSTKTSDKKDYGPARAWCKQSKFGNFTCMGPVQKMWSGEKSIRYALELVGCKDGTGNVPGPEAPSEIFDCGRRLTSTEKDMPIGDPY